jgi:hypothetical protein
MDVNLGDVDDVNVFKLAVDISIAPNLMFVLEVYEFKEPVLVSIDVNLLF